MLPYREAASATSLAYPKGFEPSTCYRRILFIGPYCHRSALELQILTHLISDVSILGTVVPRSLVAGIEPTSSSCGGRILPRMLHQGTFGIPAPGSRPLGVPTDFLLPLALRRRDSNPHRSGYEPVQLPLLAPRVDGRLTPLRPCADLISSTETGATPSRHFPLPAGET